MVFPIRRIALITLVAAVVLSLPAAPRADAEGALVVEFANGVNATIYPADYLESFTEYNGTRGTIHLDGRLHVSVVTDVDDPLIINKGDGAFHPFPTDRVIRELREITYPLLDVDVEVFILPFPRAHFLSSSASGSRVFLSPHVYEPSAESVAYITVHEMGHIFQYRYIPTSNYARWGEYQRLRNIQDSSIYYASAIHANRPVEIFAEDFRALYGGPLARFDGRVENPLLPPPSMVHGLDGFFAGLTVDAPVVAAIENVSSYPNPFNPQTELHVTLNESFYQAGQMLSIRIYDVRGALVRELYASRPAGPDVRVRWDGRDGAGRRVASSTYFGVVEAGGSVVSQKLSMIK
ncbi:MAG: hypothetical protein KAJ37_09005 [Candidatus Krumholzibacteria bacterium]|nr:hypothetical protein [Candidatus Krumholzibacteria bacterium]